MSAVSTVFVACIVLLGSEALKLPDYINPCSRTDPNLNQCILEQSRKTVPHILKGDPKYGIPNLDPFIMKEMHLEQFGFQISAKDMIVEGVKGADLQEVRVDLDKMTIGFQVYVPIAKFHGKYEMSGKLFNLPIAGKGDLNATLEDMKLNYKTFCNITKKSDGQTYIQPYDYELQMDPKKASFYFTNLFNGNKLLADAMHTFINDNYKLILKELGAPAYKALGLAVHQLVVGFADKVPLDELFTEGN